MLRARAHARHREIKSDNTLVAWLKSDEFIDAKRLHAKERKKEKKKRKKKRKMRQISNVINDNDNNNVKR